MTMATSPSRYGRHPSADRLLVALSDIEMGAGGITDDFPQSDYLADLILSFNEKPFDDLAIDLILNGDTFDLLKTAFVGQYPRHITAEVATAKLASVASNHAVFFDAIRQFVSHRGAERRVYFIVGNHDAELLFPEVQEAVRKLCGGSDVIHFPGFELDIGEVHIEHGSQGDPMFRIEPDSLFVGSDEPLLNLSWGSIGLLDVAIPLHPRLYHLDRVRPKELLFELMPELKELLLLRSWQYWTRDYLKDFLRRADPIKRITWSMVKEIAYRFASVNTEASIGKYYQQELMTSAKRRLLIVGHCHQASWWSRGDNKILQTGCIRNEYMLRSRGRVQVPIAKTYAEVYMRGNEALRSQLIELEGPPIAEASQPPSVFDFRDTVLELLGSDEERRRSTAARTAHETKHSDE